MAGAKRAWIYGIALAIAGLCVVAAVAAWLAVRSMGVPRVNAEPIPSPDRTKLLATRVNRSRADLTRYLDVEFNVLDAKTGAVLFHRVTSASARMRWSMRWLDRHEIQLTSSDIGNRCWREASSGTWTLTPCPP